MVYGILKRTGRQARKQCDMEGEEDETMKVTRISKYLRDVTCKNNFLSLEYEVNIQENIMISTNLWSSHNKY